MESLDSFVLEFGLVFQLTIAANLFLLMFAVALDLTPQSFRFFRTAPRLYFAGVFSQLVGLPAVTLAMCYLLDPHPTVALGMIVVACCPGGASSNLITLFARGNTALSVALTATSSLAAALLTPVSILFWAGLYAPTSNLMQTIGIDVVEFLIQTALLLALPIALGMIVRHRFPAWSVRYQSAVGLAAGAMLLGIILYGLALYFGDFVALGFGLIGLVVLHNLVAFATGWSLAKAVRADPASVRSITIETGIQNTGLALVILITQFTGLGGAIAVVGTWGTWHIAGGLLLVALWRRRPIHA